MATGPPTGRVALVFTDVEASSSLWERCPEAMREALSLHDALVRKAVAAARVYEVKSGGDGFMVAASSGLSAARFALDLQRALLSAKWPARLLKESAAKEERAGAGVVQRGLRVRVGIHVGSPECREDPTTGRMDYFGPPVNRAARVARAAHGGQVLLSGTAWEEVEPKLAELGKVDHQDLGEHQLRGLEGLERLVQVLPAALSRRRFPPVASEWRATNLPAEKDPFVGRRGELADIQRAFHEGASFVSLVGASGMGKSRLGRRFASELVRSGAPRGGVWLCDLSEVADEEGLWKAVAHGAAIPLAEGRRIDDLGMWVGQVMGGRGRTLLVLDHADRAPPSVRPALSRLLALAPETQVLATGHAALGLPGETVVAVGPLALPKGAQDAGTSEAVQLFLTRARAIVPDLALDDETAPTLSRLVKRLGGAPLALELGAAQLHHRALDEILDGVTHRVALGAPEGRPRSTTVEGMAAVQNAIEWTWDTLLPEERSALSQCTVFEGGFSADAAEAVLTASASLPVGAVLSRLLGRALVRDYEPPQRPGETRYRLNGSVRAFAAGKLTPKEAREAASRHAAFFVARAEGWAQKADGPEETTALAWLELECENVLAAARRSISEGVPTTEASEVALRAVLALHPFLLRQGPYESVLALLDRALVAAERYGAAMLLRARAMEARGATQHVRGDLKAASSDLNSALNLARLAGHRELEARALARLGAVRLDMGRVRQGRELLEQAAALHRDGGNALEEARALANVGLALSRVPEPEQAKQAYERALKLLEGRGHRRLEGLCHVYLAGLHHQEGRLALASQGHQEALRILREAGEVPGEGRALINLGLVLQEQGKLDEAGATFERALKLVRAAGARWLEGAAVGYLGMLDFEVGNLATARQRLQEASDLLGNIGDRRLESWFRAAGAAAGAEAGLEVEETALDAAAGWLQTVGDAMLVEAVALLRCHFDLARARRAARAKDHQKALHLKDGVAARLRAAERPQGASPAIARRSDDVRTVLRTLGRALDAVEGESTEQDFDPHLRGRTRG